MATKRGAKRTANTKKPAKKPAKRRTQRRRAKGQLAAPQPSSNAHPFVHVGHGISAARKDWSIAVVLREPVSPVLRAQLDALPLPGAFDTKSVELGAYAFEVGHGSDSLQWVVGGMYEGAGTRSDKGEPTEEQWKEFNADVDAYLADVHKLFPIAAVIRTVDEEYSTELSPWHTWSLAELPRLLPFLAAALGDKSRAWYLAHAIELWRESFEAQTLAEQTDMLATLDDDAKAVFKKHGGALKPTAPKRKSDPMPTLAEMKSAWAAISSNADPFEAFRAAFSHLWFENDGKVELNNFVGALLEDPAREDHELLVEVARRALATPTCQWPDTHWRPELVDALVQLGRIDEARAELPRVIVGAASYLDGNWVTAIRFLDATDRSEDADVLHRAADRYVTGFDEPRKSAKKAPPDQKARAAALLHELAAPFFAALESHADETLNHAAFLFEDLVEEDVAGDSLLADARRARAELATRRERRLRDGNDKLARGDSLDQAELEVLLGEASRAAQLTVVDAERLARAALAFPVLVPQLEAIAYYAKDANPQVALAVYRAMLTSTPPATDEQSARRSWLQSANNALIVTHANKLFAESAQLADQVIQYVRENPYITHSAACSYAAVERFDDAFEQVRLAVELGYPHLDKVKVDRDLGPLLKREDFKALFKAKKKPKN